MEQRFNINLNVFYYHKNIYPFYISEQHNERVLILSLISDKEKFHYVFIKDFNRMMYSQTGTKNKGKKTPLHALLTKFYYRRNIK